MVGLICFFMGVVCSDVGCSGIDPIRVSGYEHHGNTLLAEAAELRQDFSNNFSAINLTALTKKRGVGCGRRLNAKDILHSALFEQAARVARCFERRSFPPNTEPFE